MILAHIAGVPVEETLLSVGPALVAAFSVSLVHIRSLRDRSPFDEDDDDLGSDEHDAAAWECGPDRPDDPLDPLPTPPGRDDHSPGD